MSKWYFTFCGRHPFADCYVEIEAVSWSEARALMFKHFGSDWAFQYDTPEAAGIARFGLHKVEFDPSAGKRE